MAAAAPFGAQNATIYVVVVLLLLLFSSMVAAWVWAIVRASTGKPLLPSSPVKDVPWGVGSVLLALLLWIGMQVVGIMLYRAVTRPAKPKIEAAKAVKQAVEVAPPAAAGADPGLSLIENLSIVSVVDALVVLLIPALLALTCRARLADLGLSGRNWLRSVGQGVMSYLLLAPIVFCIQIASVLIWVLVLKHQTEPHPLFQMLSKGLNWKLAALATLMAAVLAPLAEEFLFRGVFLGWLTRAWNRIPKRSRKPQSELDDIDVQSSLSTTEASPPEPQPDSNPYQAPLAANSIPPAVTKSQPGRLSLFWPNVIVSLIFAGLHYQQWPAPIPLFFLSLGLGYLYQCTGSLLAPIALHATFNGVSTVLMFALLSSGVKLQPPKAAVGAVALRPAALLDLSDQVEASQKVVATARGSSYK